MILSSGLSPLPMCSVVKSCLTPCNPVDCSPPGSLSVGFSRQASWSGLPFPPRGSSPYPPANTGHHGPSDCSILEAPQLFAVPSMAGAPSRQSVCPPVLHSASRDPKQHFFVPAALGGFTENNYFNYFFVAPQELLPRGLDWEQKPVTNIMYTLPRFPLPPTHLKSCHEAYLACIISSNTSSKHISEYVTKSYFGGNLFFFYCCCYKLL